MIAVHNLRIRQGAFHLEGVSFTIPAGEYGVLMGKTGCGKTTILEAVCGLKPLVSGNIILSGRDVTHRKPAERGVGYVPQDRALFVTMTVRDHLAFALKIHGWDRAAIEERVNELAGLLRLDHLLDRRPKGLSGGESQRVALGRALSMGPEVLLLDEPLSALDDETRAEMCDLLVEVRKRSPVTVLHITHSRGEAERLADRIFVLRDGKIEPLAA